MSFIRTILTGFLFLGSIFAAQGQGVQFHAIVPTSDGFLAAGEVLARLDTEGNVLETVELDTPILSMALFSDRLYVLDTTGRSVWEVNRAGHVVARLDPPVKGHLTAVSADEKQLWAVTDVGEILHSSDALNWSVLDFNEQYNGFYPQITFTAIAAGGGSIMVAGLRPDGRPAAYTSGMGNVWSERLLDYTEQGRTSLLEAEPVSISYDPIQDRFFLACRGGWLLALPGCSHCNSIERYPVETLYGRAASGFNALLIGSGGFKEIEKP